MSYRPEILSILNTSVTELNEVIFDDRNFPSFLNYSSNPDLILKLPTEVNCPFDFDKVFVGDTLEEITEQTCPVQNPIDSQACLPRPIMKSFQVWCTDYDCVQYPDSWAGNCTHTTCTNADTVYDKGCHTVTWCSDIDNCFTRVKPPKEIYLPLTKDTDKVKTYDNCVFSNYCLTWKKVTGYWVKTDFTKDTDGDTFKNYIAIRTGDELGLESAVNGNCTHYLCTQNGYCYSVDFCFPTDNNGNVISIENPWGC